MWGKLDESRPRRADVKPVLGRPERPPTAVFGYDFGVRLTWSLTKDWISIGLAFGLVCLSVCSPASVQAPGGPSRAPNAFDGRLSANRRRLDLRRTKTSPGRAWLLSYWQASRHRSRPRGGCLLLQSPPLYVPRSWLLFVE